MKPTNKKNVFLWIAALLSGMLFFIVILRGIRLLIAWRKQRKGTQYFKKPIEKDIRGLSSEEAKTRKLDGMSNEIPLKPRRTLNQIWRENTFSKFNLSLLGIALVQIILGKPLDALMSIGILVLNISMNVFQELLARRRMKEVEFANQPKTTLIRDGKVQSVNPDDVVYGDMLIIGPGDQLYADGEVVQEDHLIIDESIFAGKNVQREVKQGDEILAGSYCVEGRGVYTALRIGNDRKIIQQLENNKTKKKGNKKELTPIEKIINKVLTIMLIVVALFTIILLPKYLGLDTGVPVDDIIDAFGVIFSLAPAGLFFMIVLTYTAGTADLAKIGALVREARSVETLAQIDTIFFTKGDVLTGTNVDIELYPQALEEKGVSETRIIQVLGDYAHTLPLNSPVIKAIAKSYEGEQRQVKEMAPFLSVYGWSAITVDDADLKGTIVLGHQQLLRKSITEKQPQQSSQGEAEKPSMVKKTIGNVTHLFRKTKKENPETDSSDYKDDDPERSTPKDGEAIDNVPSDEKKDSQDRKGVKGVFGRLTKLVKREKPQEGAISKKATEEIEKIELIFAFSPEIKPLTDRHGKPVLPIGLIGLCKLHFSEQINPDAIKTLQKFSQEGIDIKILSNDYPEKTVDMLKNAGWKIASGEDINYINSAQLTSMNALQRFTAIFKTQIFGNLTPSQAGQVVQILRDGGQQVAVLGNSVKDVAALRSANLGIALQSSNQMARSAAHIILLKDSTDTLQKVLEKGQRIVNGLMDVLKLFLNQILYLAILIVAIRVVVYGFPYKSAQGGLISALTITLPSLGFSIWASTGTLKGKQLAGILTHFLVPTVITTSAAAMVVYSYFLKMYGAIPYAQLAITYTLVGIGLMLVLLMKPPVRVRGGFRVVKNNFRFLVIVLVSLLAFILAVSIPLFQKLLKVDLLQQSSDYLFILVVIVIWSLLLSLIWFIWPYIGYSKSWMFKKRKIKTSTTAT